MRMMFLKRLKQHGKKSLFLLYYKIQDRRISYMLNKLDTSFDFRNYSTRTLNKMLNYSRKAYLYYKDIQKHHIRNGEEALKSFPIISKDILRSKCSLFISKYEQWIPSQSATTGGSTGEPFGFFISPQHDVVHQLYLWRRMGYIKGDIIMGMGGMELPSEVIEKREYGIKRNCAYGSWVYGHYAISALYLNEKTCKYYVDYILKIKPAFIRGYTSAIYIIAQCIITYGIEMDFDIKGVQLTSEMTYDYQVDLIKSVFNAPVVLQYGHTEAAVFGYTYDDTYRYKCSPLYGYVEVLDESGRQVENGEVGEVVVTSYSNYVMPFIRYRTGDMAEWGGREGGVAYLNKVIGRTQDYVYNANGEKVLLTALIFGLHYKAFAHIRKWQIVQEKIGEVKFRIIQMPIFSIEDEKEIRDSFLKIAGITTVFEYVDEIELTKRGKSKLIIQKLDRDYMV